MSISTTSLFLKPVYQAEVDPPLPESTQYTMFLPSGTPLATIARAKLQEGTLGFSWAVDQDLSQPDMAYQHNQTDLERMHPASYTSTTEDLRYLAEKVKFYNEAKQQFRGELHCAREALGEVDSHIKGLEDKLNSVGDDAQLANVDLQNTLQKQQQTLQMMSNISKLVHDTALSLIRKISG